MRTVLCYGIILGLYCLVHDSSGEDQTTKHSDAKHYRNLIPKDKVFIKSEAPLRGRKIHQTAWSEEEATENSPEELKTESSTDSWNFEKLYSYLYSLIYKTEEMEKARMTPSETVAMIRNKIKSEIKARKMPKTKVTDSLERKRSGHKMDVEATSYLNSESSEESGENDEYESCDEEHPSSGKETNNREKDRDREVDMLEEECYEEESNEKTTGGPSASNDIKKVETSVKNKPAKEGEQITSRNETQQKITILNGTDIRESQQPINILQKNTKATTIGSKTEFINTTPKGTVIPYKDGPAEISTDLDVTSSPSSNPLPMNSGLEKSTDESIQSKPDVQKKVNLNTVTEPNAHETHAESASFGKVNSILLKKERSNPATATTQVEHSKSATEIPTQNNLEVIITAPEFIPIEVAQTEMPSNKITGVKPSMDEILKMPKEVPHVYGKQSEAQNVDAMSSTGEHIIKENYYGNEHRFQKDSLYDLGRKDEILEEYNLKNEFIELSDNHKFEFMNILKDYDTKNTKSDDGSQHSSIDSHNMEFNEENMNQETFDTILEFLYKHSNNPLILSLKNSSKTLV